MTTFLDIRFDPEADAAYVRLSEGGVDSTSELAPGLIVDWSASEKPVGLEILYVQRRIGRSDLHSYVAGLIEGLFASRRQAAE